MNNSRQWLLSGTILLFMLGMIFIPQIAIAKSETNLNWHMQLHKGLKKICKGCHVDPISQKKYIYITVPSTEKKTVDNKVRKFVDNVLEEHGYDAYTVKVVREKKIKNQLNEEKVRRWMIKIINPIKDEVIGKTKYQTYDIAIDFHPAPTKLIFKTYIKSSDLMAKRKAKKIEAMIKDYIKAEQLDQLIDGEPYKIIVRSRDNKELN